jgi:hypothetical protein
MTNPTPDVISATFDACSAFAQQHVAYVLADTRPDDDECLRELDDIDQGATDMTIYEVTPVEQ